MPYQMKKMRDNKGRFLKGRIDTRTQETFDKIGLAHRGKKRSQETKNKLSVAHKGQIPWNKGKKFPEFSGKNHFHWKGGEERLPKCIDCGKKLSSIYNTRCRDCLDKYKVGEKSNNWQGGLTKESIRIRRLAKYKNWRKSVFKRDDYTCQECGQHGGYLTGHHIKSFAYYPELRFELDNGLTLCELCHSKTDNYKGKNRRVKKNEQVFKLVA